MDYQPTQIEHALLEQICHVLKGTGWRQSKSVLVKSVSVTFTGHQKGLPECEIEIGIDFGCGPGLGVKGTTYHGLKQNDVYFEVADPKFLSKLIL